MKSAQKEGLKVLLDKYCTDIDHAKHVKKLSLMLFDKTNGYLHSYSNKKRNLLKAGALLHDIGHYIGNEDHNKNSYKIIMQEGISGFDEEEIQIIANIARYHRGKVPGPKHENYTQISDKKTRKLIKRLGGIVKIADGLDASHLGFIESINCEYDEHFKILYIIMNPSNPGYEPDIEILIKKKDLFEQAFKTQVVFKIKEA